MIFVHEVRRKMSEETPRPIMLYVEDGKFMGKEMVFCKDCKYFMCGNGCILHAVDYSWEEQMGADDFCSRGELK